MDGKETTGDDGDDDGEDDDESAQSSDDEDEDVGLGLNSGLPAHYDQLIRRLNMVTESRTKDESGSGKQKAASLRDTSSAAFADTALLLLRCCPAAARTAAAGGLLPLHLAAASRVPVPLPVLRALISAHPDGSAHPDASGLVPLFLALRTGRAPAEAVQALLEAYPAAAELREPQTGRLPIQIALAKGAPDATVAALLAAHPAAAAEPFAIRSDQAAAAGLVGGDAELPLVVCLGRGGEGGLRVGDRCAPLGLGVYLNLSPERPQQAASMRRCCHMEGAEC